MIIDLLLNPFHMHATFSSIHIAARKDMSARKDTIYTHFSFEWHSSIFDTYIAP